MSNLKEHWENIYSVKEPNEVSWTQEVPKTSLNFIQSFNLRKDASVIDVGGGESRFVDFLLDEGFANITVLDISEQALRKTRNRLREKASTVKWVVSDIIKFKPIQKFDVWHDRATFHFLTTKAQIEKYVELAGGSVNPNGFMAIGTFSDHGPKKCSGLAIKQYSESELEKTVSNYFRKIHCITEDHITPFHTIQNFLFCSFKHAV